ncbi:hypothetical protein C9186_23260 [Escherichia coli]|nr:hypothetical protein CGC46_23875 [Escherichia coli O121:H19]AWJ27925.1 hypothetical protein I3S_15965 [Escherichia coli O121 str. RM8352]KAA9812012.1 hypothetical protein F7F76_23900 [Escherichia coli]KAA9979809.1 hypothetical protein F7F42_23135 [Escherichia coli]KAB0092272.1 hypothetical protein F7F24_23545 [Escherichia coli]
MSFRLNKTNVCFRHEAFRLPGLYIARKSMHIVGIIQRIRQKDPTMGCDYAIWLRMISRCYGLRCTGNSGHYHLFFF